jgi:hypothetical protein
VEMQEKWVNLVNKERKAEMDSLDSREEMDEEVYLVHQDLLEKLDQLVSMETLVKLDMMVSRVIKHSSVKNNRIHKFINRFEG